MLIKEVIEAVWSKQQQVYRNQRSGNVNLCVYMTPKTMSQCTYEIRDAVSPVVMEFYEKRTIFGYQVHLVTEERDHPTYRIVNLNG
jgi:hypothetical protein